MSFPIAVTEKHKRGPRKRSKRDKEKEPHLPRNKPSNKSSSPRLSLKEAKAEIRPVRLPSELPTLEKKSDPSDNGYEQFVLPAPCEEQDEKIEVLVMEFVTKAQFYHGKISEEECASMLKERGDFLVRAPEIQTFADKPLMVTVFWNGAPRDIPIIITKTKENTRTITINKRIYRTKIMDLIKEHMSHNSPVDHEALLLNSVLRPMKEISRKDITCETQIGSGAYGTVFSGKYNSPEGPVAVAIKRRKIFSLSKEAVEGILMEAKLMTTLNHRCIVKMYGLSTDDTSIWIIMEYIALGSLDTYIRKNPSTSHFMRWSFCWDVCNGLAYLHQNRLLHRDMAARNCLVDVHIKEKSERKIVKISDFGMSRKGDCFQMASTEYAPIRWEAPEIFINAICTKWSDIWAFGMVIYEVFTGNIPFYEHDTNTVREKIQCPDFRPTLTDAVPEYAKETMKICWHHEMTARKSMRFHSHNMIKLITEFQKKSSEIHPVLPKSKKKVKKHRRRSTN